MDDLHLPQKIYLIGMPGSGKSTLGRRLANKLAYQFHDLDQVIEATAGKNINRIFEEDGESGFRRIENQCLQNLSEDPAKMVIATGGGTPCFHDNMHFMNSFGVTIFLNVPLEIIAERLLEQGTDSRPLLRDKTATELLTQLHDHFDQRKVHYMNALIHLEGGSISEDTILVELNSL